MAEFQPFVMERFMSMYEQDVQFNLSESGVNPLPLRELLEDDADLLSDLLETPLNYPHVNGIPILRENIASLYEGSTAANVLVTVGAIEANYNSIRTVLDPGDEIVIMVPNYMQIWGLARNHGLKIKTFGLKERGGRWVPDLEELARAVSPATKLIAVCNPNNPTGSALTRAEMLAILSQAEKVGAWLLADEVYAGAERVAREQTPSFYGLYDKVLAIGSMSKAYGLPGLRIGWVVAPPATVDEIWARHEYTCLSASMLSNKLAAIALSPTVRPRLLDRARKYVRNGFGSLEKWIATQDSLFSCVPPDAAAIAFVKYELPVNSTELVDGLREKKSVLVVPGDHFGMDHYLRISFGLPEDYVNEAFSRITDYVASIR